MRNRKNKRRIDKNRENYLDTVPHVNPELEWIEEDDIVIIRQRNEGFSARIAQKLFGRPEVSNISLDRFGSFVWINIDGKKSVFEIGKSVSARFGEEAEPLYERLSRFILTLEKVGYISTR